MLQALLETSAQCPQNDIRLAAQKALEPLVLKAEILSPLLQPPSLGPLTPTPTAKRAKITKEPRSPQPAALTKATQGMHQAILRQLQIDMTRASPYL